jgi:hypothetical protein
MGQDSTPVSISVKPLPPRSKRPETTRPFARNSKEDRACITSKPLFDGMVENSIIAKMCVGKENMCPTKNQILGVYNRTERNIQV